MANILFLGSGFFLGNNICIFHNLLYMFHIYSYCNIIIQIIEIAAPCECVKTINGHSLNYNSLNYSVLITSAILTHAMYIVHK